MLLVDISNIFAWINHYRFLLPSKLDWPADVLCNTWLSRALTSNCRGNQHDGVWSSLVPGQSPHQMVIPHLLRNLLFGCSRNNFWKDCNKSTLHCKLLYTGKFLKFQFSFYPLFALIWWKSCSRLKYGKLVRHLQFNIRPMITNSCSWFQFNGARAF